MNQRNYEYYRERERDTSEKEDMHMRAVEMWASDWIILQTLIGKSQYRLYFFGIFYFYFVTLHNGLPANCHYC